MSMKMSLITSDRKIGLLIFCDLNLLDYAILEMMKKMFSTNVKQLEDIEGLSATASNAWDRLTQKFINNSIDQWQMRLEKVIGKSIIPKL